MSDREKELKEATEDLEKALGDKAEESPKEDEPSTLGLLGKALDVLKSVMPGKEQREAMDEEQDEEGDEDEDEDPRMKKSGEDQQEYGDQHRYNRGGSQEKPVMKKFDYEGKMSSTELDEYANALVTVKRYREKYNMGKSLEGADPAYKSLYDVLDDPDLSAEDQAMVVNEFIDDLSKSVHMQGRKMDALLQGVGVLVQATKKSFETLEKAQKHPRGRVSTLSVVGKGLESNRDDGGSGEVDWESTMQKALVGVKQGKLNADHVSSLELARNSGGPPNPAILKIVDGISLN